MLANLKISLKIYENNWSEPKNTTSFTNETILKEFLLFYPSNEKKLIVIGMKKMHKKYFNKDRHKIESDSFFIGKKTTIPVKLASLSLIAAVKMWNCSEKLLKTILVSKVAFLFKKIG